ncbi:uncharacterized protein LOC134760315 [Pongo abelii]|uniref:uncharacterized protein LOC134760315 n=1 Tax=Pongo abelii TaxID=9601 RepID=UPI0030057D4E
MLHKPAVYPSPGPTSSSPSSQHSGRLISDDQRPPCDNSVGTTALPPAAGGTTNPSSPAQVSSHYHLLPSRLPEPSARRQGLEIEQNRPVGEGEGEGLGGRRGLESSLQMPKTQAGLSPTSPRPTIARRGDRGLFPAPPGKLRKVPGRLPRRLLLRGPQTLARCPPPSHNVPRTPAQTSGSGTAAASLSTADAETPFTSLFPAAPGAGCFRSAGLRRRGER